MFFVEIFNLVEFNYKKRHDVHKTSQLNFDDDVRLMIKVTEIVHTGNILHNLNK